MAAPNQLQKVQVPDNDLDSPKIQSISSYARSPEVMERFAEVLGDRIASRYVSSVLITVLNDDKLQKCTPRSIMTAAMKAANLSLSCDSSTGQAYLVPFRKDNVYEASLIVGYKGLKDMALRTGRYKWINVGEIYEGQELDCNQITGAYTIKGEKISDKVVALTAGFELKDGFVKVISMTIQEIHEHARTYSKSYDNPRGIWKNHTKIMEQKTILRRVLTRWGFMDPHDTMIMSLDEPDQEEMDQLTGGSRNFPGQEIIDMEPVYDPMGLPPEDQVTLVPPPAPRSTNAILDDLGFDLDEEGQHELEEEKAAAAEIRTPERLRAELLDPENAGRFLPATEVMVSQVAAVLSTYVSKNPKSRHAFQKFLFGKESLKELDPQVIGVIHEWLNPVYTDGMFLIDSRAKEEITRVAEVMADLAKE